MAAVFCWMYLSKPVILQESPIEPTRPVLAAVPTSPAPPTLPADPAPDSRLAPAEDGLPGDKPDHPRLAEPQSLTSREDNEFEETNLRIQHVLGAQASSGEDLGRIVLDVPVLYQSGTIRWSSEDVAKARSLLARIDGYQVKSRALRDEAVALISEWDSLIVASIPESALRADSPTLPENQGSGTADAAPINTTEAIEIAEP